MVKSLNPENLIVMVIKYHIVQVYVQEKCVPSKIIVGVLVT